MFLDAAGFAWQSMHSINSGAPFAWPLKIRISILDIVVAISSLSWIWSTGLERSVIISDKKVY
tara:strand:+ start:958 stop:1146 length:189 start_codon:yes stop_codon:yes gene_type:complete